MVNHLRQLDPRDAARAERPTVIRAPRTPEQIFNGWGVRL